MARVAWLADMASWNDQEPRRKVAEPVAITRFLRRTGERSRVTPWHAGTVRLTDDPAARIAELRAQGLSVRAISERTGIPRSTVADHVAPITDAMPVRIVGRDGRRYLAVRDPRLDEPALGEAIGQDAPRLADPGRELHRLLLLGHLRQARDLVPDVVPLAEHDRLRIALDLVAITRIAGVRDGDVARARVARRRAPSTGNS